MRPLGLILLLVGFFAAAFVSVRQLDKPSVAAESRKWHSIDWIQYGGAMAVGVVGVVLLRVAASRVSTSDSKVAADLDTLRNSLDRVIARLQALLAERQNVDVYAVSSRIDSDFLEDLGRFVDARETIIPVGGLKGFANVMSDFASGERLINRAWCASADGYVDEVWASLAKAEQLMQSAREHLAVSVR